MCVEQKVLLSGELHEYHCELVLLTDTFGLLRYIIDREYHVNGITLHPGEVSLAFYWTNRPYTLYTWRHDKPGRELYYFNIADRVSLEQTRFVWRDLVVDILIDEHENAHILDEDELPSDLNPELRDHIERAKNHLLTHYHQIIAEVKHYIAEDLVHY
ncbi:MAG TPA: DUF402 domain-containing protein [Nitrospirota bacterium]|nr:DUF402 domain-containing protein [Nitrospirota bacterium]